MKTVISLYWHKHRLKKILLIIIGSMIIFFVAVLLSASLIAKHLVEKYAEKYTGRKITMGWTYVNPFTGYIQISNLKIYEYKSDSIFIATKGLSANLSVLKLFSKTVELSNITLDQPMVRIIQRKHDFNFNDLITKVTPKGPPNTSSKPFLVKLLNIKINHGHFFYIDEVIPVHFSIKDVDIESKYGWRSDHDLIFAKVSFLSEIGTGGMKGNFGMNVKSLIYKLDVIVRNFDLNVLEQYLKGFARYGTFRANLDANLKTNGCFKDAENININGKIAISGFHLGKDTLEDYVSFDKVALNLNDVNPKTHKYFIDSALLIHPYFKYERYDGSLDNIQTMFGKLGGNVSAAASDAAQFNLIFTIGGYIKNLAKNFFKSDFKVNHLAISRGDINFTDYTLSEKFATETKELTIIGDSIYKDQKRVNVSLLSMIKPYGNISISLSISPKDTGDFDLQYHLRKVPVSIFNPYTISYTSYPLDRGTIEFNGTWNVRNGMIQSINHLVLIDPRVTKRLKNKDNKWIPVPLIMAFVRERGNVIDYEIPITGKLNDPNFHLHDVIMDLLSNVFVKPSSIPYGLHVKNIETKIEKSLTLQWKMRQSSLAPPQEKFIEKISDFLAKNPEASIKVYPQTYALKEKEYILFFEAKKKYFLLTHNINARSFSEEDSEKVDKMSVKDPSFVHFLDRKINDSMIFTIQDKCTWFIDSVITKAKFEQLNKEREKAFVMCFKEKGVEKQVKISTGENVVPYNGFSFYKIEYKGEFPESLTKAYRQMNELNNEAPRNKLKQERRQNSNKP